MIPSDLVLAGALQLLPHVCSRLITARLLSHCLSTASRGGLGCRLLSYCNAFQQQLELRNCFSRLVAERFLSAGSWLVLSPRSRLVLLLVASDMSLSISSRPALLIAYMQPFHRDLFPIEATF